MEMELLNKLQETQKKEREAYTLLENVMIDTAVPRGVRMQQTMSVSQANNNEEPSRKSSLMPPLVSDRIRES